MLTMQWFSSSRSKLDVVCISIEKREEVKEEKEKNTRLKNEANNQFVATIVNIDHDGGRDRMKMSG